MGIGNSSPGELLDVRTTTITAGQGARIGQAKIGTWIGNTDYASFAHSSLASTAGSYCLLHQSDGDTFLNGSTANNVISFRINNSEKMLLSGSAGFFGIGKTPTAKLDVNGDSIITGSLSISNGNIVIGTAGKGIDFSITPDSGTATPVELLDDYEEGTWTPELSGSDSVFPNQTNYGSYTKIGNQVTAVYRINVSSSGNTFGALSLVIKGWPFKSTNASSVYYTSPIYIGNLSTNGTGSTGYTSLLTNNDTTSSLYKRSLTGNTTTTVKGNDLSGSAFLQSTLIYFTDD
jgi:hypothetical protein